jgi:hypothetical protein
MQLNQALEKCKLYMKAGYPTHVLEEKNEIASHCRVFALNNDADKSLSQKCDHNHSGTCEDCDYFISTLHKIKTMTENTNHLSKHEIIHDVKNSN